jgi:hypothetical protein
MDRIYSPNARRQEGLLAWIRVRDLEVKVSMRLLTGLGILPELPEGAWSYGERRVIGIDSRTGLRRWSKHDIIYSQNLKAPGVMVLRAKEEPSSLIRRRELETK